MPPDAPASRRVVYRLRQGVALEADEGQHDVRIINEIWMDNVYARHGFEPRASWRVVDLGANKGFFTSWVLHRAPRARVAAYEPDPDNFDALRRNVAQFAGADVGLHAAAVGATEGAVTLHRLSGRPGQASLDRARACSRGEIRDTVAVRRVPLAEVLGSFDVVDLLKMDIEGSEYEAIIDSPPEALANVRRLVLEADPFDPADHQRTRAHLLACVGARGFRHLGAAHGLDFFERRGDELAARPSTFDAADRHGGQSVSSDQR